MRKASSQAKLRAQRPRGDANQAWGKVQQMLHLGEGGWKARPYYENIYLTKRIVSGNSACSTSGNTAVQDTSNTIGNQIAWRCSVSLQVNRPTRSSSKRSPAHDEQHDRRQQRVDEAGAVEDLEHNVLVQRAQALFLHIRKGQAQRRIQADNVQ